jgi:hypothetical protein
MLIACTRIRNEPGVLLSLNSSNCTLEFRRTGVEVHETKVPPLFLLNALWSFSHLL